MYIWFRNRVFINWNVVLVYFDIVLKIIVRIYIYLIFYFIICIFFMGFFFVNVGMVGLFYFVFNEKKIFKYEC